MRLISQLSVVFSLLLIFSCNDNDKVVPSPAGEYNGAIFIGCDGGPYGLNIDSLIAHCTSIFYDNQPLDSILAPCLYDELGPRLSSDFDMQLERSIFSNTIEISAIKGDPTVKSIPLVLQGLEYLPGEYPYYNGYQLTWSDRTLRVQVVNKWIGGCFLDLILWEAIVH